MKFLYREDIPQSVSINEAVELAKRYSTQESAKFINGILGSFARDKERPGR
jgi:N utilization substance protein B